MECLDLGPLTPHYSSKPMPNLEKLPCLHPLPKEDFKIAKSQAEETQATINELKTEIALFTQKKDMSQGEKNRLDSRKKKLERHVNEFKKYMLE